MLVHGDVARGVLVPFQFETIHPFIDGNGRTGRALIHTVLRRGGALRNTLIPISTVFAGDTNSYLAGLTACRADPSRFDDWIIGFAYGAELAAQNAARLVNDVTALDEAIRAKLIDYRTKENLSPTSPRHDAVVLRVLDTLSTHPVLTTESVATRLGVSGTAAHRALTMLAEAKILGRMEDQAVS